MQILPLTSQDGTRLRAARFVPPGKVRGHVLLVHGLAEHLGRYQWIGEQLAAKGWQVIVVELRGHGGSEGKRGHVQRWSRYVEDLRAAAAEIPGNYVLMAHSMGALVALDFLRTDADRVVGVGLSGPLLGFSIVPPRWKSGAAKILSKVLPSLSMVNEIDANLICSDPAVVKAYVEDPLVFNTVTPRWFIEMKAAFARVHAAAGDYRTPMYVAWGQDDRIVSPPAIERFVRAYGGKITARPWERLRHEIWNEPVREKVLEGYLEALDRWIPA